MADAEKKRAYLVEGERKKESPRNWQVSEIALGQLSQEEQWKLFGQAGGGLSQTGWENWKTGTGETIIPVNISLKGARYES